MPSSRAASIAAAQKLSANLKRGRDLRNDESDSSSGAHNTTDSEVEPRMMPVPRGNRSGGPANTEKTKPASKRFKVMLSEDSLGSSDPDESEGRGENEDSDEDVQQNSRRNNRHTSTRKRQLLKSKLKSKIKRCNDKIDTPDDAMEEESEDDQDSTGSEDEKETESERDSDDLQDVTESDNDLPRGKPKLNIEQRAIRGFRHHRVTREDVTKANDKSLKAISIYEQLLRPFINDKVSSMLKRMQTGKKKGSEKSREDLKASTVLKWSDITIVEQPFSLNKACIMRSYQLQGLSWLVNRYEAGMNCILADEMGLGKTLQTISFMSYLVHVKKEHTPFLVIVPLSVLFNWIQEFRRWCPSMKVQRVHASAQDPNEIKRLKMLLADANKTQVVVTTYDMAKSGPLSGTLKRMSWNTVILDEGHRVKNEGSNLSVEVSKIKSKFRMILTGTPVQNNLHESWALLHYLYPCVFTDSTTFDEAFNLSGKFGKSKGVIVKRETLDQAHYMIRPFILRRLKGEVEQKLPKKLETMILCPMSDMQKFWVQRLLFKERKNLEAIEEQMQTGKKKEQAQGDNAGWKKLASLMAQLRKAVNHPFLFSGVEKVQINGLPTDEIVTASGKMEVLSRLLKKLQLAGHRVVLFSQFTRLLDILSDWLEYEDYKHCRLDGGTNRVMREVLVNQYNRKNSPFFLFLLSTRAGGEGINLTSADTVIIFDSDWNPQVDIQAMARVHRIGQTKTVHVYRLVTEGSVEERIVQRAQKKLFLDGMVNRGSTSMALQMDEHSGERKDEPDLDIQDDKEKDEVFNALKFGWNSVFTASKKKKGVTDAELDRIIDRKRGMEGKGVSYKSMKDKDKDKNVKGMKRTTKGYTTKKRGTIRNFHQEEAEDELNKDKVGDEEDDDAFDENQEFNLTDFDESCPLVNIREFEGEVISKYDEKTSTLSDIAASYQKVFQKNGHGEVLNSKRPRESRLVEVEVEGVGLVHVLKENDYGLEEGEPSIYHKELKKRSKNESPGAHILAFLDKASRQIAGRDYHHQEFCQNCWDGGDLIVCDFCPAAYHLDCLGLEKMPTAARWSCPAHDCFKCSRRSSAAGLLFRCEMCPRAYCEDCLPANNCHVAGVSARMSELGYRNPGSCCYVLCSARCILRAKEEGVKDLPEELMTEEEVRKAELAELNADEIRAKEEAVRAAAELQQGILHLNIQAVNSCKLGDVWRRLNRVRMVHTELQGKFACLGDLYGFKERFKSMPFVLQEHFKHLLEVILRPFGIKLAPSLPNSPVGSPGGIIMNSQRGIEAAKNKARDESIFNFQGIPLQDFADANDIVLKYMPKGGLRVLSKEEAEAEADIKAAASKNTTELPKVRQLRTITPNKNDPRFQDSNVPPARACPEYDWYVKYCTAFIEGVKYLAQLRKNDLLAITRLLNVLQMSYHTASKRDLARWNERAYTPLIEPKFRTPNESNLGQRARTEEVIASFLVTLLPQNLIIRTGGASETEKKGPGFLEGEYTMTETIFYLCRASESQLHKLRDSNNIFFTGLTAYDDGSIQALKDWIIDTGPLDVEAYNKAMAPCVRLYKAFVNNPGQSRDDLRSMPFDMRVRLSGNSDVISQAQLASTYQSFFKLDAKDFDGYDSDDQMLRGLAQGKRERRGKVARLTPVEIEAAQTEYKIKLEKQREDERVQREKRRKEEEERRARETQERIRRARDAANAAAVKEEMHRKTVFERMHQAQQTNCSGDMASQQGIQHRTNNLPSLGPMRSRETQMRQLLSDLPDFENMIGPFKLFCYHIKPEVDSVYRCYAQDQKLQLYKHFWGKLTVLEKHRWTLSYSHDQARKLLSIVPVDSVKNALGHDGQIITSDASVMIKEAAKLIVLNAATVDKVSGLAQSITKLAYKGFIFFKNEYRKRVRDIIDNITDERTYDTYMVEVWKTLEASQREHVINSFILSFKHTAVAKAGDKQMEEQVLQLQGQIRDQAKTLSRMSAEEWKMTVTTGTDTTRSKFNAETIDLTESKVASSSRSGNSSSSSHSMKNIRSSTPTTATTAIASTKACISKGQINGVSDTRTPFGKKPEVTVDIFYIAPGKQQIIVKEKVTFAFDGRPGKEDPTEGILRYGPQRFNIERKPQRALYIHSDGMLYKGKQPPVMMKNKDGIILQWKESPSEPKRGDSSLPKKANTSIKRDTFATAPASTPILTATGAPLQPKVTEMVEARVAASRDTMNSTGNAASLAKFIVASATKLSITVTTDVLAPSVQKSITQMPMPMQHTKMSRNWRRAEVSTITPVPNVEVVSGARKNKISNRSSYNGSDDFSSSSFPTKDRVTFPYPWGDVKIMSEMARLVLPAKLTVKEKDIAISMKTNVVKVPEQPRSVTVAVQLAYLSYYHYCEETWRRNGAARVIAEVFPIEVDGDQTPEEYQQQFIYSASKVWQKLPAEEKRPFVLSFLDQGVIKGVVNYSGLASKSDSNKHGKWQGHEDGSDDDFDLSVDSSEDEDEKLTVDERRAPKYSSAARSNGAAAKDTTRTTSSATKSTNKNVTTDWQNTAAAQHARKDVLQAVLNLIDRTREVDPSDKRNEEQCLTMVVQSGSISTNPTGKPLVWSAALPYDKRTRKGQEIELALFQSAAGVGEYAYTPSLLQRISATELGSYLYYRPLHTNLVPLEEQHK